VSGVGPGGVSADDRRWDQEAEDLRHTSLEKLKTSAEAWEKSVSALLGVFSVVAFVKGPATFEDLGTASGIAVAALVLFAAAFAVAAIACAAVAAQGIPTWQERLDGAVLRSSVEQSARRGVKLMWASRITAIVAALLVLAATSVAWLSQVGGGAPSPPSLLVVQGSGALLCGEMIAGPNARLSISATGKPPGVVVEGARSVTPVDACPRLTH
jgi:hypothetical protein